VNRYFDFVLADCSVKLYQFLNIVVLRLSPNFLIEKFVQAVMRVVVLLLCQQEKDRLKRERKGDRGE
jgi:hypothetical protein